MVTILESTPKPTMHAIWHAALALWDFAKAKTNNNKIAERNNKHGKWQLANAKRQHQFRKCDSNAIWFVWLARHVEFAMSHRYILSSLQEAEVRENEKQRCFNFWLFNVSMFPHAEWVLTNSRRKSIEILLSIWSESRWRHPFSSNLHIFVSSGDFSLIAVEMWMRWEPKDCPIVVCGDWRAQQSN